MQPRERRETGGTTCPFPLSATVDAMIVGLTILKYAYNLSDEVRAKSSGLLLSDSAGGRKNETEAASTKETGRSCSAPISWSSTGAVLERKGVGRGRP